MATTKPDTLEPSKFGPKGRTKLVEASILQPELSGLHLIVVPCSETGKPDTALHQLMDKKWPVVGRDVKGWFAQHRDFKLGSINTTAVQSDVWAVHMLCLDKDGQVKEDAVVSGLKKLSALALAEKASVHMSVLVLDMLPMMQDLVTPHLLDKGVHCYFYLEPGMGFAVLPLASKTPEVKKAKVTSKPKQVAPKKKTKVATKVSKPPTKPVDLKMVDAVVVSDTDTIK